MTRNVIAWVNMSIDGFSDGADDDPSWLLDHVTHDQLAAYFEGIWRGADTALLGRTNFEGFEGYWPAIARDPDAKPRDREVATWLDEVEKVVFSRTLNRTRWKNSRVAKRELVDEVRALKDVPGRDIILLNSASLIQQLLAAGLVDELRLTVLPELLGAGLRLFDGEPSRSSWRLAGVATLGTGAIGLHYRRWG